MVSRQVLSARTPTPDLTWTATGGFRAVDIAENQDDTRHQVRTSLARGGDSVITVNGVTIGEEAIAAEVQYHPAASLEEAKQAAAQALVVRQILLQEADRMGIKVPPDSKGDESAEEARIRLLMEQAVKLPEPDEASCKTYFRNNRSRFRSPDLFEVSHILFVAPPDDPEARDQAKTRAEDVLVQLREAPERFAVLAAEHSSCPSRATDGSLGQISRGQTVPEFEAYVARMKEGEIAPEPVETRYGYHIVYLHRRKEGNPLSFELVEQTICDYLRESVMRRAVSQYIQLLAGKASIEGIDMAGAETRVLQE